MRHWHTTIRGNENFKSTLRQIKGISGELTGEFSGNIVVTYGSDTIETALPLALQALKDRIGKDNMQHITSITVTVQ